MTLELTKVWFKLAFPFYIDKTWNKENRSILNDLLQNYIEKYILLHYLIIFLLGYGDYELYRWLLYGIQENLIVINFGYFINL